MSVSDALVAKCTESVVMTNELRGRIELSEDETLRDERERFCAVISNLALCVKQLEVEVDKLDRRIENLSGQLTR